MKITILVFLLSLSALALVSSMQRTIESIIYVILSHSVQRLDLRLMREMQRLKLQLRKKMILKTMK